ncbi:MAG: T9SS type A sorting domain-containing protein, partial [Flavobacteriales bacterium]
ITGIENYSSNIEDVNSYPNPAKKVINIDNESNYRIHQAMLFDVNGKMMKLKTLEGNSDKLNVNKIQSGNYFLKLIDKDGKHIGSVKVILNK